MDGLSTAAVMGGFIATWAQLIYLNYKMGKLEAKIERMNGNNKNK